MSNKVRWVAFGITLVFLWFLVCLSQGQTAKPDRAQTLNQLKGLIKLQGDEIDRVEKDLKGSKEYAATLWTDLEKAQAQVNQVGKERNDWRDYGNDQHEKFINAEKRVAEKQATILKLFMALAGLGLLIGAYLFAKFYLRLPI